MKKLWQPPPQLVTIQPSWNLNLEPKLESDPLKSSMRFNQLHQALWNWPIYELVIRYSNVNAEKWATKLKSTKKWMNWFNIKDAIGSRWLSKLRWNDVNIIKYTAFDLLWL